MLLIEARLAQSFPTTYRVTSLEMSPLDDQFLAGSQDTVRLWDLRSPNCQVKRHTYDHPEKALDLEVVSLI